MIIDQMSNAHLYQSLHPGLKPAFDYCKIRSIPHSDSGVYRTVIPW